jgi:hypothetical protein
MLFKLVVVFSRLSFANFLAAAQRIKVALNDGPALTVLPDPWPASYPTRAQITAAYTDYETAFDAARDGSRPARNDRDQKRAILEQLLTDAAPYFEAVAKKANDITILNATGYDVRQPPQPAPNPLPAPALKVSRNGSAGTLIASAPRVRGGRSYVTQLCAGDPTVEDN